MKKFVWRVGYILIFGYRDLSGVEFDGDWFYEYVILGFLNEKIE